MLASIDIHWGLLSGYGVTGFGVSAFEAMGFGTSVPLQGTPAGDFAPPAVYEMVAEDEPLSGNGDFDDDFDDDFEEEWDDALDDDDDDFDSDVSK